MKYFNFILFLFPLLLNAQIFVDRDAAGANDGSSWANAYTDLQDAIQNAPLGVEVWVAAGTYLPSDNGDVDATFTLTQSIDLYGGFAGNETDLSERDVENNLTILSGDYNNNDNVVVTTDPLNLTFNNNSENAKRVITAIDASGSIIVDGFTISGGNSLTSSAGGVYFSPDVELTVLLKNCILKNNSCKSSGGALVVVAHENEVINFRFENSSAINNSCSGASLPKGGAVHVVGVGTANVEFINVLFHQNFSGSRGGALNFEANSIPVLENCVISENRATNGGAIFELVNSGPTYRNCTFYKNVGTSNASVIWKYGNSGMDNTRLLNCIFHNNGTDPLYASGGGAFDVSNTLIEYNTWADFTNQGNSDAVDLGGIQYNVDPQFVDQSAYDFNLSPTSPMVNAGDNSIVQMDHDHTGNISRIVDGTVDIGALEYHLPLTANVVSTLLCFGSEFGFAELTADNYPPFTYQWNDATVVGATPNNLSATGNHQVTVTNEIGDVHVLDVTLIENPEIEFTTGTTDPTGMNPDGTATVNVTGGVSPFSYEWNTNPVQTTPTATGLANGNYTVMITDANGCVTSASLDVGEVSAVQSVDDSDEIEIGPNPFNESVQIIRSGRLLESTALTQVLIYSATGSLVYNSPLSASSNTSIDLSHLSAGIYFMELVGKDVRFRKRLIK